MKDDAERSWTIYVCPVCDVNYDQAGKCRSHSGVYLLPVEVRPASDYDRAIEERNRARRYASKQEALHNSYKQRWEQDYAERDTALARIAELEKESERNGNEWRDAHNELVAARDQARSTLEQKATALRLALADRDNARASRDSLLARIKELQAQLDREAMK